jgi:BirA family biotin operon repressor/biotin-[acetyl-CoA-carboxylase] ligase
MFDLTAIIRALGDVARRFDIDLLDTCDSTNAALLARAEGGAPSGTALVAERQTAGRGRRGRSWIAAPGDSLTFSLLWRFAPETSLAGLSLAVGLAVANALDKVPPAASNESGCASEDTDCRRRVVGSPGTAPIRLKWPNDLLKDDRKLGGILVELVPGTPHAAVIGIGLNLRLPAGMPEELRAHSAALDGDPDPNALLAAILAELLAALETFAAHGFAALRPAWAARHAYENAPVRLLSDFTPPREGICRGVDVDGALLFDTDGRIERVLSGEVSLRPAT